MTLNMWIATTAWLLLFSGVVKRKNRRIHIPCMISAIALDTALVVYLQVTRNAIETAVSLKPPPIQMLHIGASTAALLLYFPVMYFGLRLSNGDLSARRWHLRLAVPCFAFRTAGFLLMFSMWR